MAIRTYKVTLDSKNTIAPEPVFLRQGDKTGAVVIDATLMDNGAPVSLDGLTPMFKANTADGQAVIADSTGFNIVNASGGEFTYQVPNALSAVPGKITTAYFSFSDTSGSESTFDVAFVIKKAVDITQEQADDYITIIDGTIQTLQDKIDALNTDVQTIIDTFNSGDFYNKKYIDDFVNENIPQNVITITHNLNKMMLAVVYYYSNAIGTETGGLASGPTGSFGGIPLKTVASQTEITSLNEIKVTIPNNFKLTGTPTLGGDGNYFINENEYTLKFKLVYYE